MNLSKNSWHRKLYEFWWVKSAPNNLCNYFWGFLLVFVTLPLLPGRALYDRLKETPETTPIPIKVLFYIVNTSVVLWFSVVVGLALGNAFYYPVEALAIVGGLALLFIVGTVLFYVYNDTEIVQMTSEAVKAKKNKVCPRITWH